MFGLGLSAQCFFDGLAAFVLVWMSLPKMGSRPLATIVTCTIHGLRLAPGCCQVEVSVGRVVLALVVILVCGFCGGNGIPEKGRNIVAKIVLILT